jgi:hypothetical protein
MPNCDPYQILMAVSVRLIVKIINRKLRTQKLKDGTASLDLMG